MTTRQTILTGAFLLVIVMGLSSCAMSRHRMVPLSVRSREAELLVERAEGMPIRYDTPENRKKDLAKRDKLYDKAIEGYLAVIALDSGKAYRQRAHFKITEIFKKRYQWAEVLAHYQSAVQIDPASYFGKQAQRAIDQIHENRQRIEEQLERYQTGANPAEAAEALYAIASAYEAMGDYPQAIRAYEKLVKEFPADSLAPKAQYRIGEVYFYNLYDYSNTGGWGAFLKVVEMFPDTFEASQAKSLLKEAHSILTDILQTQARIAARERPPESQEKKKAPPKVYVHVHWDPVAAYQHIAAGWIRLKNYPYVVAAYRTLIEKHAEKRFGVADALYRIGQLYQLEGQYERAIAVYDELFQIAPESTWRVDAVYQQGVCYQTVRKFDSAYGNFKAYMRLAPDGKYYHEVDQSVQEMEKDQDSDGYPFYQERMAGTSDENPSEYPGAIAK